jgi:hypothetical protein
MAMNRTLCVFTRWRFSIAVVLALFALSAAGCSPDETTAPPKGTTAPAPPAPPTEAPPKTKGGAPKLDTTSRRAHQKEQRAQTEKTP